jgi:hypothetical protein
VIRPVARAARCGLLALAALATASAAAAQQTQLDLHGNLAVGTSTHTRSWGLGLGPQFTFGSSSAPVKASVSPGFDYLKQEGGGPSQESASLDVNIQPGGSSTITPYAGASVSANWSSGDNEQWSGSKLGREMMGGLQIKASSLATVKAEERFGYVDGQEHTLTTRLGVLLKL